MKAQAKTATKAATVSTKAARNTPVTKAAKAAPKAATVSTKADTKAATETPPKAVFSFVAGTIRQLSPVLAKAIKRHHVDGLCTIEKCDAGHRLTAIGAAFFAQRAANDPADFARIAAFVHGAETPKEWAGQPISENTAGTMQGKALKFPNLVYWGGFARTPMRLAFAALWSTKA